MLLLHHAQACAQDRLRFLEPSIILNLVHVGTTAVYTSFHTFVIVHAQRAGSNH
jgi:hypothetical protein